MSDVFSSSFLAEESVSEPVSLKTEPVETPLNGSFTDDDVAAVQVSSNDGPDDVTERFFEAWGNAQRESRPERDLCYSMLLQAAHDVLAINHQRRWEEAQEEAVYWCRHPYEGVLSLSVCVDVLFPEILGQYSLEDFGELIIHHAEHISKLEFPNSNIATPKDRSPVDFIKKLFNHKEEMQG